MKRLPLQANLATIICTFIFIIMTSGVKSQVAFDTSSYIRSNPAILSLVVSVKDSVVFAKSFNSNRNDELLNHQSLTKNVMAVLLGIAIDSGFIASLDTKVAEFLPELKSDPDRRKLDITVADIMNQASGLWHENLRRLNKYLRLRNPSAHVLTQPLISDPGSELHYNNAATHLLSVILSEATGQSTFDFARRHLFQPLGINHVEWPKMNDGYHDGGGLLSVRMTTTAMHKIGMLLLHNGRYNGKQVVSEDYIKQLIMPRRTYAAPWDLPDTQYGLTFYHQTYKGKAVTFGMGWGGQFLMMIPDLDAVIAINQRVNDKKAIQQSVVFTGKIFPLIVDILSEHADHGGKALPKRE